MPLNRLTTNQEILTEAIKKAIAGEWVADGSEPDWNAKRVFEWLDLYDDQFIANIIFNHDFAKALWGQDLHDFVEWPNILEQEEWAFHLQQMVIADDPIVYLGENI